MSGLKAIILYNSYYKGLKTRIPCDGHTNLGGDNGAGKTSALRLLPIFFGQEPGKVMDRSGNKKNFVDYYLTNDQSMVIFEYARVSGETCCAVFYRSSEGSQHAHRFVMGSADETIFHPDMDPYYEEQEPAWMLLRHRLKEFGVTISQQLNYTSEYRDIIFNTAHINRRSGTASRHKSLREEARAFSLGGFEDRIQHMHELTSITLDSKRLISRLKRMIIDTQIHVHIQDSRPNSNNPAFWRDIESLQAFERASGDLASGVETYQNLMASHTSLHQYTTALDEHVGRISDRIDLCDAQEKVKGREFDEAEAGYQEAYREHSRSLAGLHAQRDQLDREIDALYEQRDEWEEKGMDDIAMRYHDLPNRRQALNSARQTLSVLKKEGEDLQKSYDSDRAEAITEKERRTQRLRKDKDALSEKRRRLADDQEAGRNTLKGKWEEEEARVIGEIDERIGMLQQRYGELLEAQQQALQPTDKEIADKNASKSAITTAEGQRDEVIRQLQLCQDDVTEKTKAVGAEESHLQHAERRLSYAEAERDALTRNRFAEPGTLLAYLREHFPRWGDSLGKVISPALLQRKDLQPERTSHDETLYGLALYLEHLAKPDEAMEEAQLDSLLTEAKQEVKRAKDEVEKTTGQVLSARKALKEARDRLTLMKNKQDGLRERIQDLKAEHQRLVARLDEDAARRANDFKQQAASLQAQITEEGHQKTAQRETIRRDGQEALLQLRAEQTDAMASQDAAIEHKTKQIEEIEESHKAHLKSLDDALQIALGKRGVDTKARQTAIEKVEALRNEIQVLEDSKEEVLAYEHWLAYDWPTLDDRSTRQAALIRQISISESEFARLKSDHEAYQKALSEARRSLKREIGQLTRTLEEWRILSTRAQRELDGVPHEQPHGEMPDADALGSGEQIAFEVDKLASEVNRQTQALIKIAKRCKNIIQLHPNTQVHDAWLQLYNRLKERTQYTEGMDELDIASMSALSELLHERVPEIENMLKQTVRGIADRMVKYRGSLNNLNNEINRVSRELRAKLNTEHDFVAISDIKVQLVSLISSDEQWKPLSALAQRWGQWLARNESGLPPDELMEDLRQLDEAYRNGRGSSSDISDLTNIEITLKEKGREVPIRTDKDFSDASSAGLSLMALLIVFSGLTRYLCPNEEIAITWPIDELGKIDSGNVGRLFKMMQRRNIHIFCAQPEAPPEILKRFDNRVLMDEDKGAMIVTDEEPGAARINPRFSQAIKDMSQEVAQ
ncbi:ATP-binding protein [Halomonas stenophila]|uniref:DNA repair exonuclease SbcCD ATPase subunit n=1 Tax=Halomonas stenophila TaxID=795312 RepID=A0A7W5EX93_9GAMM|nr:ATP-binding protein [Halomonas stenophila]MBB3231965.1 DNA repair exonuclease SbcCD ATPase subunit [Halomonas stenophila]